ncbi:MAG: hypothetical protein NDI61_05255 [Bdellovibrionaceae bacterium]|nr:hypothetical protein [Pseudobdellovibrionaceae bacterium]
MAPPFDNLLSTRSYVVLLTGNSEMKQMWSDFLPAHNVRLTTVDSVGDLLLAPSKINHLLGAVIDLNTHPDADQAVEQLEKLGVSSTRFKDGVFTHRDQSVRASAFNSSVADNAFHKLIVEPTPQEIRNVWIYALNTMHKNIFPDIQCTIIDGPRKNSTADLWVSCQLNGDGFLATIGIGMDISVLRRQSDFYAGLDQTLIVDSLSEFANQTQGIMSYNLSLSKLEGRINLPTLIDERSMMVASSCIRSTFYVPLSSAHDDLGLYTVDYGFMTTRGGPRISDIAKALKGGPVSPESVDFFD